MNVEQRKTLEHLWKLGLRHLVFLSVVLLCLSYNVCNVFLLGSFGMKWIDFEAMTAMTEWRLGKMKIYKDGIGGPHPHQGAEINGNLNNGRTQPLSLSLLLLSPN